MLTEKKVMKDVGEVSSRNRRESAETEALFYTC